MNERKHLLRPLKGRSRDGRHLLLWIDTDEKKTRLVCKGCRAWDVLWSGHRISARCAGPIDGVDALEKVLDDCTQGKGTLTVWLARGWEDLVLSGLAQLIDKLVCSWRYALLDGQKILIRGAWRGRPIAITSLANWVGERWNAWPKAADDGMVSRMLTAFDGADCGEGGKPAGEERLFLATWCALAATAALTKCTSLAPTVAGAAMQAWRSWIGPRFKLTMHVRKKGRKRLVEKRTEIVAPSPFRPKKSALAERHSCYGLSVRQLRRGLVDETVYCLDLRSAYALALMSTIIPLAYRCVLANPSTDELAAKMSVGTAHALVRIKSDSYPYPVRRGKKASLALGHYWTWLAGAELAHALCAGHVAETKTAYIWHGRRLANELADALLSLGDCLNREGYPVIAKVWRTMYSALVGQFAGRRRVWRDIAPVGCMDRWCQWTRSDLRTGAIVPCRSIAGKCQELARLDDTTASVPFLFACVTAQVRWFMQRLSSLAGRDNVLAIVADSVWVTQPGWQALQTQASKAHIPPDTLRTKGVYDRVWFTGRNSAVMERKGVRVLKTPGCHDGACLDDLGKVTSWTALAWTAADTLDPEKGVGRRKRSFPGQRIIDLHSTPAVSLPWGDVTDDPLLPAELLEPARYGRTVEDV